jgi:membrane protein DedA with SNARE-associated domain
VPTLDQALTWLSSLPAGALYALTALFAFVENLFPPFPSDSLIGGVAFLAAIGEAKASLTLASTIAGSALGALVIYGVGRRYGAEWVHQKVAGKPKVERREQRLEDWYERYGLLALFVGRLIPGVRSLVPALAGATRANVVLSVLVMTAASAIWYGVLTWLAFQVGDNFDDYSARVAAYGRWGAVVGVVFAIAGTTATVIALRRRHRENAS